MYMYSEWICGVSVMDPDYQYCMHTAQIFFFGLYSDRFCYQENISNATADKVKAGMLEGVEAALGLSKGSLKPLYARVQLWWETI